MEESRSVDESAVTIFGGAQPEVLKKLHKGKDDNGLWSRIIFDYCAASPTKLPTSATSEEISKFKKAENYLELDKNQYNQLIKNSIDARFTNLK